MGNRRFDLRSKGVRMTILDEAAKLVDGDRGDTYGHPIDDFSRVTRAAEALGIDPVGCDPLVAPLHHALYMILVKLSRLVQSPYHRDSLVDVPGYARTYEKCLEEKGLNVSNS